MEKFNKVYSEIKRLNKLDPATASERVSKLLEEAGELAKEVNKTTGRKVLKPSDTPQAIRKEMIDEGADTIQNVLSILDGFGVKPAEILEAMVRKNKSWAEKIKSKKRGPEAKNTLIKAKAEPAVDKKSKDKNGQKRK